MEKILIVLEGVSNSGKTTTLNKLIKLLENKNKIRLIDKEKKDDNILSNENMNDIRCIFEYTLSNNTVLTIGIATGGDTEKIVSDNIEYFNKNNCDIMINATKSKGKTVDYIHKFIKNNKNITFLPFYKATNKEEHDEKLAQDILKTIFKYV